ncbi:hypothetical protein LCGC14_2548580, partial [marine sediment metagenome]
MAELVYQTWERITGRPWSDARKSGFTTGSYADNIALQKRLLGGWRPYAPKAAPRPAPKPAPKRRPRPAAPSPGPVPVQPGLTAEQFADQLALGEATLAETIRAAMVAEAQQRIATEAQYAANPADFVAYELYKRSLEEQGYTPQGAIRSDVDIQDIFSLALGLDEGLSAGTGQFGVDIPTTGSISRSELQGFNPTDIGILSSFLRGGVETDGGFQGINPEDFFTELEEGLVPTLTPQRT